LRREFSKNEIKILPFLLQIMPEAAQVVVWMPMFEFLPLGTLGTLGDTLAAFIGLVGLLASLFFVYTFARRLRIFGGNRIREWRDEFVASRPVQAVANLGGLPLRWRTRSAIKSEPREQKSRFASLGVQIPITTSVYKSIRMMANHPEPISAILKTTSPATLKKTSEGIFPIITEMQMLESFDHLRSINHEQKPRVVATLHNHKDDYGLAETCEKKLSNVDLFFGRNLVHIVVCPNGMQLYRSVQSSAIKAEQWK
jgi:hypothetical protein